MNPWQEAVQAFHEATGASVNGMLGTDNLLRAKLIAEETAETIGAMGYDVRVDIRQRLGQRIALYKRPADFNLAETVDGLVDLIYVTVGAAVTWGLDLDPFFEEVQRANMSKAGGPKREDGKILKPEGWQPPDIARVLLEQLQKRWDDPEAIADSVEYTDEVAAEELVG